ncbi:MAG: uracil-DNA glycosylase [Alphaproteobacteria bacterium]|nr:uracil-DNA glycosylase [Alphaproteobacteria bacterium]
MNAIEAAMPPFETLRWYLDAGVDECVGEVAANRFAALPAPTAPPASLAARQPVVSEVRPASSKPAAAPPRPTAPSIAAGAKTLDELKTALLSLEGCALKSTATQLVFADGNPEAKVMFIGEAPGADEDRIGRPFVGQAGRLLDKMLGSIGLDRDKAYITNLLVWRPPGNRTPTPQEVALLLPFLERHIELVDPELVVLLGGTAAQAVLAKSEGITKLRGKWFDYATPGLVRPVHALATFHPAYLLRQPAQKREAWRDLLMLRRKLDELGV